MRGQRVAEQGFTFNRLESVLVQRAGKAVPEVVNLGQVRELCISNELVEPHAECVRVDSSPTASRMTSESPAGRPCSIQSARRAATVPGTTSSTGTYRTELLAMAFPRSVIFLRPVFTLDAWTCTSPFSKSTASQARPSTSERRIPVRLSR